MYNQLLDVEMLKNINWSNWDIENMGYLSSESSLQTLMLNCKFTILNTKECKFIIANCKYRLDGLQIYMAWHDLQIHDSILRVLLAVMY